MPTAAWAAEEDEGAIASFQLKASNGYRVLVIASRQPGKARGHLLMLVGSKRGGVTYTTSAGVEESGIHADLGELGRIDLEYVPLKGTERHVCGPGGDVSHTERGEYRGVFELHGEEGYTEARVNRLDADFGLFLDLICSGSLSYTDSTGAHLPGARLNAVFRRGSDSAISLEIKKNRPAAPAAVDVSVRERRGTIRIRRDMETVVGPGAFRFDPRLRVATVAPPAPFDGTATFRREAPPRNRWTGNLTVDLPGRADTPLAEPGFRVRLVHASWSKSREGARRSTLGRPLALLETP